MSESPEDESKHIFDESMRERIERLAHPDEEMRSLIEAVDREIEINRKANEDAQR